MAQPPCKLVVHPKPGYASTFVVQVAWRDPEASGSTNRVDDGGILWAYAFTKLMGHAGAVAVVDVDRTARYFVLTVSERGADKFSHKLREEVGALQGHPEVVL